MRKFSQKRRNQRGAVALEYILIAALVAIALMGAFLYFRKTMDSGVRAMTDTAAAGIQGSIDEANKGLTTEGKTITGPTK